MLEKINTNIDYNVEKSVFYYILNKNTFEGKLYLI